MNKTYFSLLQPELRKMLLDRFAGVYWVMRSELFAAQHQLYSVRVKKGSCYCPHCSYLLESCNKIEQATLQHGLTVPQLELFLCIK